MPDFNCSLSASKLFWSCWIEKFRVKLKLRCTFCMRNALCWGLTVIPPKNFNTSKENGSPNKDAVKRSEYWCIRIDTKVSLIKLLVVVSDSTAKTTLVLFDPSEDSKDNNSTYINRQWDKWNWMYEPKQ